MSNPEMHPDGAELDSQFNAAAARSLTSPLRRELGQNGYAPLSDPDLVREPSSGGGMANYLHAFRRRWFLALTLGVIGGTAAAAAAWISAPTVYTATALIRVSAANPKGFLNTDDPHSNFDIYKGTQMQLITSDFVVNAALNKIPDVETPRREVDSVHWLARALQTESPTNAEIIYVRLTLPDKNDVATIVNAVVGSYKAEVVDKERDDRKERYDQVDKLYVETDTKLRNAKAYLKKKTKELGADNAEAIAFQQQVITQQYTETRTELHHLREQLRNNRDQRATKSAALKAHQQRLAVPSGLEAAISSDTEYQRLQQRLTDLETRYKEDVAVLRGVSAKTLTQKYQTSRNELQVLLDARRQELADRHQTVDSGDVDQLELEVNQLTENIRQLAKDEQQTAEDFATLKKQMESLGSSSVDVDMTRNEIEGVQKFYNALADERQQLDFEQRQQPRITYQLATPPVAPDKSSRAQNTIMLGMLGFMAPIGLLLWWDVRGRRINTISDVADGLGLTVIGTVPHIVGGASASRALKRRPQMQVCLDHSIDGIAAKLFLRRDASGARVVLVSSATRGEGKSTLSIQLAKRLARTGASTLLVDFDLRKPSLHHVFEAPRGPGLTEYLRGGNDLSTLIRETGIENLSLLTSGAPFTDSLGTLSNGVTRSLFNKARETFDFVIVDGSPILPVVDALLTSQHVDAVVLSVRRDISQAHRVKEACAQLAAFGVEEYVAVLSGTKEELFYYGEEEWAGAAG
jgi:capsular exopolysaccharide synthesis family protein